MGLQDLTGKEHQIVHAYEVSGWGCMISRVRNNSSNMPTRYPDVAAWSRWWWTSDRICLQCIRSGLQDLRVGNYRSYMPTRHQEGTSESHGFETPDRTCLLRVRTVLHNVMGSEHKIVHAYNVSGRSCRISRVGNYRSYMPTRYQEVTLGSHGIETPDRTRLWGVRTVLHYLPGSEHKIVHAYRVSGRGCKISLVRQTRSYIPTLY